MTQRFPKMTEDWHVDLNDVGQILRENFPNVDIYWEDSNVGTPEFERIIYRYYDAQPIAQMTMCPKGEGYHIHYEPGSPLMQTEGFDPDKRPGFRAEMDSSDLGLPHGVAADLMGMRARLLPNNRAMVLTYSVDKAAIQAVLASTPDNEKFEFNAVFPRLELAELLVYMTKLLADMPQD